MDENKKSIRFKHIVDNIHVVCLNENCDDRIKELQQVIKKIKLFTDIDECIDFITDINHDQIFVIVSEVLYQAIIHFVEDISQINCVYILSDNKNEYQQCTDQSSKVKKRFTDITSIYENIKHNAYALDQNSVSISFIQSTNDKISKKNLDELDQSFMYTQILKEILLTIDFKQNHIDEFLKYCQEKSIGDTTKLKNEYYLHSSIWWYTSDCFPFEMLNKALRLMEIDVIMKIGFFIRALHQNIDQLHSEQYREKNLLESFTLFRGQGLSLKDFDELMKTNGGLISFNSFLSTTTDEDIAIMRAESNAFNRDLVGILFKITIDSANKSTPFCDVTSVGHFGGDEKEILFSMHSIFRVKKIQQSEKNNRIWQVDLILTTDNDPQLSELTEHIREETFPGQKGWYRLGEVLIKLGEFEKAQEIYNILLEETSDLEQMSGIYFHLGWIKDNQGKYEEAIEYYTKILKIDERNGDPNHRDTADLYNNLGLTYNRMSQYSKALQFHGKALAIRQRILPPNDSRLASSYNNLGRTYDNMGDHLKALSCFEKALKIYGESLPSNHPHIALSHNNLGVLYIKTSQYKEALLHLEKARQIQQRSLPPNHSDLIHLSNNVASVYGILGDYSKAISYFQELLEIIEKISSSYHPTVAALYNNIGSMYEKMNKYWKALYYHQISYEIRRKILPPNHLDIATSYNNIGGIYGHIGKFSKALFYFEKALKIFKDILPPDHFDFTIILSNIGLMFNYMRNYSKALLYYEKVFDIGRKSLPPNHCLFLNFYNNIGGIYHSMGDYSKALTYFERALQIGQHSLPENHPDLQSIRTTIQHTRSLL